MSAVAGVRSDHRQVGEPSSAEARTSLDFLDETSNFPSHMSSTPNFLREQAVDLMNPLIILLEVSSLR